MEINDGTAVIPEDALADSDPYKVTTLELAAVLAEETLFPAEEFVECTWPCKATKSRGYNFPKA